MAEYLCEKLRDDGKTILACMPDNVFLIMANNTESVINYVKHKAPKY